MANYRNAQSNAAGVLIGVVLALFSSAGLAEVSAWFDRSSMYLDETVGLNIQIDAATRGSPDLTPLAGDFRVLGTASSTQVNSVNGQTTTTTTWAITLEPLRVGKLTAPALEVAGQRSNPVTVEVQETPVDSDFSADQDIVIEVEATPTEPFVQAQVDVVVRLYYALTLLEGSLGEPNTEGAVVQRVEGDVTYDTERDGRRYRVTERRYALFPERSGEITIPSLRFVGRVPETGRRASRIDQLLSRGRQVAKRSEPITLNVRPRPDEFPAGATWLPASDLSVREIWPDGAPSFVVGEPVTRSVVTEARGLLDTQLPEVLIPEAEGFKVYPDQSRSEARHDGNTIIAQRDQKMALVPARAGALVLPEIRVPWWNTRLDRLQWATIPERTINVRPAAGGDGAVSAPPVVELGQPALASDGAALIAVGHAEPGYWRWVSLGLVALWMMTLALWWADRRAGNRPGRDHDDPTHPDARAGNATRAEVIAACKANDPQRAARALIAWARREWQGQDAPASLGGLAQQLADAQLSDEVKRLDRALYASNDNSWQGDAVARHIGRTLQRRNPPPQAEGVLPALWRA